ncbi:hypothetical protein K0M31_011520 [Melipona bicolor]|uniref:Uncharacterized protein n=1 Tax=Melipona bicolor TaxID=60889 RepID=A0AA40G9W8_9HYME|nr:hypothetical protein K0M31_011520 [Melipona bicolor]
MAFRLVQRLVVQVAFGQAKLKIRGQFFTFPSGYCQIQKVRKFTILFSTFLLSKRNSKNYFSQKIREKFQEKRNYTNGTESISDAVAVEARKLVIIARVA